MLGGYACSSPPHLCIFCTKVPSQHVWIWNFLSTAEMEQLMNPFLLRAGDLSLEAGVLKWVPILKCANPACIQGNCMPLPYEGPSSSCPDWPIMDWGASVVCRFCERGQIYGRKNIRWLLQETVTSSVLRNTNLIQIELKCNCDGCSASALVHAFSDDRWNPIATLMQLSRMEGSPSCPTGHWVRFPLQIEATRSLRDFREARLVGREP